MADIRQAAKWMDEGKMVKRPDDENYRYYKDCFSCLAEPGINFNVVISIEDLLARDWEIAE
jgi:hypothetical protein